MTIRAFFHTGQLGGAAEFESVDELFDRLESVKTSADSAEVVLRFPDDGSFYSAMAERVARERKAQQSVGRLTLPGASVKIWLHGIPTQSGMLPGFLSVDGEGWRVIWTLITMQQAAQAPMIAPVRSARQ
jgi:hypothetical protein